MKIDQYAFQQARRVATFGLVLQLFTGLTLLIFSRIGATTDTAFELAAQYILLGSLVWISLIVIFHQHRLERLEALETDELKTSESVFEADEVNVAAGRLRWMHTWLMPIVSILITVILTVMAGMFLWRFSLLDEPDIVVRPFEITEHRGWAIAICLFLSLTAFIFSRFVAGMAQQEPWRNLRGGSAYMVGNALVMLAIAAGIACIFLFDNAGIIHYISVGIAIFMLVIAAEIVLNLLLNLYRPRRPGEVPRPAFDSKLLSLFAAPDSIVRTINEAVNYQFGFDVTSSWGYQLLLRSAVWLVVLAGVILVGLSMIVIVEPGEAALRLRGGRIVGEPHESGAMFKLPWPFETAEVVEVARIRELPLGPRVLNEQPVQLWSDERETDVEAEPFIVASATYLQSSPARARGRIGSRASQRRNESASPGGTNLSEQVALVHAEILLHYRIKPDGIDEYVRFSPDIITRRQQYSIRERALREIALREVSRALANTPLDAVLGGQRATIAIELRQRIQEAFDRHETGVKVTSVLIPFAAPPGEAAADFENFSIAVQNREQMISQQQSQVTRALTRQIGDAEMTDELYNAIMSWEEAAGETGPDDPETIDLRKRAENLLLQAGGESAAILARGEADRWETHMGARIEAGEVLSELPAYRAAPELYIQRRIMAVLARSLQGNVPKYIIGIDPERVRVELDMKQPDLGLDALQGMGIDPDEATRTTNEDNES